MGSLSIGHWLIVLAIVMLVFGTKRLGGMGSDLGKAVKGFKDGVKNNGEETTGRIPDALPATAAAQSENAKQESRA